MGVNNSLYILIIYGILLLPVWIAPIIANWFIYRKAGDEGWKAVIPIYSQYTLYKLAWDKNVYWFKLLFSILFWVSMIMFRDPQNMQYRLIWGIILLITYAVLVVFHVFVQIHLSKAFGHNGKFAVGLIFVNTVFSCILGFGKAQYIGIQPIKGAPADTQS